MSQELADAIDTPGTAGSAGTAAAPAAYPAETHWYDLPDDEADDITGDDATGEANDAAGGEPGDPGDARRDAGPLEAGPRDERDRRRDPRAHEGPV